jgi:hypothetical protein
VKRKRLDIGFTKSPGEPIPRYRTQPNTLRAYAVRPAKLPGFSGARGLQALPALLEAVVLYITQLAGSRCAVTVQRRPAAISQTQRDAGHLRLPRTA